jgi:hypothetical protein
VSLPIPRVEGVYRPKQEGYLDVRVLFVARIGCGFQVHIAAAKSLSDVRSMSLSRFWALYAPIPIKPSVTAKPL